MGTLLERFFSIHGKPNDELQLKKIRNGYHSAITDATQSTATPFAADIFLHDVKDAGEIVATIENMDTINHFTITVGNVSYNVAITEPYSCECSCFVCQLRLCRHTLTCLLQEEMQFQRSWIPQRFCCVQPCLHLLYSAQE